MSTPPTTRDHLELLAAAVPRHDEAHGFATSPRGTTMLAQLHTHVQTPTARAPRSRRRMLIAGLALTAMGATAAAAATIVMTPVSPTQAMCFKTLDLRSDAAQPIGAIEANNPAATCTAQWATLWPGIPQPAAVVNCVYPGGHGLFAAPAARDTDPAQACASIGAGITG